MEKAKGSSPHRFCPPKTPRREVDRYLAGEPETVRQIDAWIEGELIAGPARSSVEREDLKQLVHLKLLENLRRRAFRRESSLRTYACRIARFTVIDFLRRCRLESARKEVDWNPVTRSPDRELEARELSERLMVAIDRCPERCRELWLMILDEKLTYPRIAEILGVPVGTVKSRVWNCRRRLLAELEAGLAVVEDTRSGH